MTNVAFVYVCMVVGYASFEVVLSVFTVNVVPLRVAEDVYLLGLVVFACYTVVLDHQYYKEGQFLLVDGAGAAKSCKSRFLDYFPLDHLCRDVVAACSEHATDTFRYGEDASSRLGRLLAFAVTIVFTVAAVWFEHRMLLT